MVCVSAVVEGTTTAVQGEARGVGGGVGERVGERAGEAEESSALG